jgi:hypothetical protein
MTAPFTYAEARKIAEPVTSEVIAELIAQDDNPYIFPGPGKRRRIAMDARFHQLGRHAFVGFDFCNRNGYGDTGTVDDFREPIFNFERPGRIVRWVRS